jgi:hypothetical protein
VGADWFANITSREYRPRRVYRQPGLLRTPQNFAQSSKILGKKYFWYKITSEAFVSISQNLKVTRLQGGTQTKL